MACCKLGCEAENSQHLVSPMLIAYGLDSLQLSEQRSSRRTGGSLFMGTRLCSSPCRLQLITWRPWLLQGTLGAQGRYCYLCKSMYIYQQSILLHHRLLLFSGYQPVDAFLGHAIDECSCLSPGPYWGLHKGRWRTS